MWPWTAVPFRSSTPTTPARARCARSCDALRSPRCIDSRHVHPRPGGARPSRRELAGYLGGAPRDRRRQRDRRADARAARARRRAGRRGRRAVVHVLRLRRGDPAHRRAARVLRRRPRHVLRHRRDRAGGADAAHEGGRSPCTCSATWRRSRRSRRSACRCSRTPPRPPARARPAARRPGALGTVGDVLVLPVEEPRRASATAARSPTDDDERRRARADAALPRLARQVRPSSSSATTRASTSCRRRSCACSCRTSTPGATGRRAAGARTTRRPGLGELVALPRARRPARRPAWHLYVVRHAQRRRARRRRSRQRGIGQKAYYRRAGPPRSPRCASTRRGRRPARHGARPPRTHLAIPMSPVLSPRPGGRGRRRRARCASGST